jgi:hypothetical protein
MVTQVEIGVTDPDTVRRAAKKQGATEIAGIERRCFAFQIPVMYSREVLISPMLESLLSDTRRSDLVAPIEKEAFYSSAGKLKDLPRSLVRPKMVNPGI